MIILDGKKASEFMLTKYSNRINKINKKMGLAVISVDPDDANTLFINQKEKACIKMGIEFKKYIFKSDVTKKELISLIEYLNEVDEYDGILVQLPLPSCLDPKEIINHIDPAKDVDGLTSFNIGGLMYNNDDVIVPCTALGIMDLIDFYNIDVEGKHVVIVGRSNLVGKPLIPLFLNRNATVTIVHKKTIDISSFTKTADILVVAAGSPKLITQDMVKKDAVVIDVGISIIDGKTVGDVDYNSVKEKASYISPVPGGVGPMTIEALIRNIYYAHLIKESNEKNK